MTDINFKGTNIPITTYDCGKDASLGAKAGLIGIKCAQYCTFMMGIYAAAENNLESALVNAAFSAVCSEFRENFSASGIDANFAKLETRLKKIFNYESLETPAKTP